MKKSTIFSGVAALALFALVSCGGEKTADAVDTLNQTLEETNAELSDINENIETPVDTTLTPDTAVVVEEGVVAAEAQ